MYMYIENLALYKQHWLICYQTKSPINKPEYFGDIGGVTAV